VATAEISRSQVWQWLHTGTTLADTGERVTEELVRTVIADQLAAARDPGGRWDDARAIFEQVAMGADFVEFLTLPAYRRL